MMQQSLRKENKVKETRERVVTMEISSTECKACWMKLKWNFKVWWWKLWTQMNSKAENLIDTYTDIFKLILCHLQLMNQFGNGDSGRTWIHCGLKRGKILLNAELSSGNTKLTLLVLGPASSCSFAYMCKYILLDLSSVSPNLFSRDSNSLSSSRIRSLAFF